MLTKKRWFCILIISFVLMSILAGCGQKAAPEKDEKIILKLAHSFPESHYLAKECGLYWALRVEELTEGKVEFQYFPAEQLGKELEMLDIVKNGVAEVAYVGTGYHSDKIPLSTVGQLPAPYTTSMVGTKAYWKVLKEHAMEEFLNNNIRPMFAVVLPPYQIGTTNKKINSYEDLKGVKLRCGGIQSLAANAIGCSATSMAAAEMYTALQRKTLDGTLLPVTSYKPYQLEQLIKYVTTNVNMGSFPVTYCVNEKVWQSLPKDVQEAMLQAGEDTMIHTANYQDENVKILEKEFKERGIDVYEVDADVLAKMIENIKPVQEDWAKQMDRKGVPGTEVLNAYFRAIEELN